MGESPYSQPPQSPDGDAASLSTSAATPEPTPAPAPSSEEDLFKEEPLDHPDITALKKQLQSGFHKLVSKRDQEVLKLKSELDGLKGLKAKAEAWERVTTDPKAAEALQRLAAGGAAQAATETYQGLGVDVGQLLPRLPEGLRKAIPEAEHQKSFLELVQFYVDQALLPRMAPYQKWIEEQVSGQWQTQEQAVVKEFQGAEQYLPAARDLVARTGLTMKQALLAVSDGAVLGKSKAPAAPTAEAPVPLGVGGMPQSVPRDQTRQAGPDGNIDRDRLAQELEEMYRRQTGKSFGSFFR